MRAWRAPSPVTRVPVPLALGAVRAGVLVMSGLDRGGGGGGDELPGGVEVVGCLEGDGLDALHGALGQSHEGARRCKLHEAGDTERRHRLHAPVPTDRIAYLADE